MGTFSSIDILSPWTFWHREFSTGELFGAGTFQHGDITALGNFDTIQSNIDILAQTFWHLRRNVLLCRNVHFAEIYICHVSVPKCPCAKISLCLRVHMQNSLLAKTSMEQKSPHAEMFLWWHVCAKMSLVEMSGAEISPSLLNNLLLYGCKNECFCKKIYL